MSSEISLDRFREQVQGLSPCEHRTVSRNGRIVCAKISVGDNGVTPNTCRACPFKAVNCAHLRFSLRQKAASPLIVRFNGRTEIWEDDAPVLSFEQAACAVRTAPITHPRQCAGCPLRQPVEAPARANVPAPLAPQRRTPRASAGGRVVPFPSPDLVGLAG